MKSLPDLVFILEVRMFDIMKQISIIDQVPKINDVTRTRSFRVRLYSNYFLNPETQKLNQKISCEIGFDKFLFNSVVASEDKKVGIFQGLVLALRYLLYNFKFVNEIEIEVPNIKGYRKLVGLIGYNPSTSKEPLSLELAYLLDKSAKQGIQLKFQLNTVEY
ncbi:MAG: hypothetical protein IH840_08295 [Candidatus Heimdallarchaeota archaeon]|nr:hypothetical protein [Candidatus Heimdallarchaeota archaeon]